ncbi:hypothetical protein T4E_10955, partial [Trichinella pseudospiralis]
LDMQSTFQKMEENAPNTKQQCASFEQSFFESVCIPVGNVAWKFARIRRTSSKNAGYLIVYCVNDLSFEQNQF